MKKAAAKKAEKVSKAAAAASKPVEKAAPKVEPEIKKDGKPFAGVGVIATIIESIKKKALSKEEILDILVAKFPDRKANGMRSTITIQLGPSRLPTRFNVQRDGDKFRIVEG